MIGLAPVATRPSPELLRCLADLDDLLQRVQQIKSRWQVDMPQLFTPPRGRRIDDVPTADGLDTTDCSGILKGNQDIVCERGEGGAR